MAAYNYISKLQPKVNMKKCKLEEYMRYGPEFLLECLLLHIKRASAHEHLCSWFTFL
jgi:hypothetical protein